MPALRRFVAATIPLLLLPPAVELAHAGSAPSVFAHRFRLAPGETRAGDLYLFTGDLSLAGTQAGDLVACTKHARIDGRVEGDLVLLADQVSIRGQVGDSTRVFAGALDMDGTVDGDLLVFSGELSLREVSHVTGNLVAYCGMVVLGGAIDGDVTVTSGAIEIDGPIAGHVTVEADAIKLGPRARILGDLTYTSRKSLETAEGASVAGATVFKEKVEDDEEEEDEDDSGGFFGTAFWIWHTTSTMLVGLILVALFRGFVPAVTGAITRDKAMGALIGFGTFLVVPAAAFLAIVLVLSAPLGVVTLVLFLLALYLAKVPVAAWLGSSLLGRLGRPAASPYLAVVLGLLLLKLLYLVPYLGKLAWLVTVWLGLGAVILAVRARLAERSGARA